MTSERERWEEALAEIARLAERARAAEEHARRERERGREERAQAEAQRAQWAETARLGERARAEVQRRERERGREERAQADAVRAQWTEIARLEERARAAKRHARWEALTKSEERPRAEEESTRSEHARSAHFLLEIAVRLLPPSERDRYLEEFRAELLDIPRDTRLSHARSLLRGAFVLRLRRGLTHKAAGVRRAKH
jgi:phage repressor protein C with HTH and peptisase S24 domain